MYFNNHFHSIFNNLIALNLQSFARIYTLLLNIISSLRLLAPPTILQSASTNQIEEADLATNASPLPSETASTAPIRSGSLQTLKHHSSLIPAVSREFVHCGAGTLATPQIL